MNGTNDKRSEKLQLQQTYKWPFMSSGQRLIDLSTDILTLRSYCMDKQADLELCCIHLTKGPFSHDIALIRKESSRSTVHFTQFD